MDHPLVYEVNTRCWLRELSAQHGRGVTLTTVPDELLARWRQLGFTHIWLMGVWTTGRRSRAHSSNDPGQLEAYRQLLPDLATADVAGSPYAIAEYEVPRALGGPTGLRLFRQRLQAHGLKLILDFVPNHLGLDHAWVEDQPGLFVQSDAAAPETFRVTTAAGPRWLAYGKDPYFAAWQDTVQLDYRRPETRAAMLAQLQAVAELCDGVRCDMAMLLLNEVFAKTWSHLPGPAAPAPTEFWADAIPAVKHAQPGFLFLAEVYWDLEAELQSLGFDYTYDKRLYDYVAYRNHHEITRHLLHLGPGFLRASTHFLENHDEPRIASILDAEEHRAAALLVLGLPGLTLLHEGQLTGARVRVPVQLARRPAEPVQPAIAELYEKLLTTLETGAVKHGTGTLLPPRAAWPDNSTAKNFVLVQWRGAPPEFDLVVVNLAPHRSQCYAPLALDGLPACNWQLIDLLGDEVHERRGDDLQSQGLYLDLPPHGAQLFHFQPLA